MSRETVEMERYTCDGCGKEHDVPSWDGTPIPWFNGHAMHHHEGGGYGAEWDACSLRCIGRAVKNALTNSND